MVHRFLAAGLFALAAPVLTAGEKRPRFPDTPPPLFVTVADVHQVAAEITLRFIVAYPVEERRIVLRNGKEIQEVTYREEFGPRLLKVLLRDMAVYNTKGEKLPPETVLKRLDRGKTVLVSQDGKRVHPNYLQVVQDDVLVLVPPPLDDRNWIIEGPPSKGRPQPKEMPKDPPKAKG